ncbi:glyoxalase [Methylosinus sp. R-45379]|uniref:ArsI/CadI family heavy metal resistance metalloenzyme n=1 Tax=unclassified Methylosinus TaxID=2624500 RepID=UPI00046606AF|nr:MULTISPECIES: ArsI/CadI family heavy metal resistance metalloenzyme [unclassified Methylosinus]OAI27646.1 glyoxalase [Methylosinus sp. R-45379]
MKRLHLHVSVEDLPRSIHFYSALFGAAPTVAKPDYAKWMLDDPRVNFAISARGGSSLGLEHLGIQVETTDELQDVYGRLKQAGGRIYEEGATTCCYAQSEKSWIADPQGLMWETFLTTGESAVYGGEPALDALKGEANACCAPTTPQGECCPPKPELPAKAPCCGAKEPA